MGAPKTRKPATDEVNGLSKIDTFGGAVEIDNKAVLVESQAQGCGAALSILARTVRERGGDALFAGDTIVGFIIPRRHGFDAVTAQGHRLGRFNTQDAAGRAIFTGTHRGE